MPKTETRRYPPLPIVDAVRWFVRGVSRLLWRIEYHGLANVPPERPGGLLVVANHQTYFDPFWICAPLRRKYRFMAWDKAFEWFFVGWLIRYLGSFPVDTKRGTTKNVLRESYAALADGATLLIFPEGARTFPDGRLLEFKTGAVRVALDSGAPILPVTVRGAHRVWSQTMKFPQFRQKVEVFYHPPFTPPPPAAGEDRRAHLERVTARLAEIIGSKL